MKAETRITWLDYLLMYLLVGISSMPFLIGDAYLVLGFVLTSVLMIVRKKTIDYGIVGYSLVYVLLIIGHVIFYEAFDLFITIAFFLRIAYAYFTVKLLGSKITEVYLRTIVFLAIASLVVYALLVVYPPFWEILRFQIAPALYGLNIHQDYYHIFIFTMNIGEGVLPRNPGAFWEPGGFGVFLNLALVLHLIQSKQITNKRSLLFIITVLTTQSTGSYIVLALIFMFYFYFIRRSIASLIVTPLLAATMIYAYETLPFMKVKFEKRSSKVDLDDTRFQARTRLVAAMEDWKTFKESPLIGEGRFVKIEEVEKVGKQLARRSNGTSQYFAVFGLLGVIAYFGAMTRSMKKYCVAHGVSTIAAFISVIIIMVIGASQSIFFKPFFMAFSFFFLFNHTRRRMLKKNLVQN